MKDRARFARVEAIYWMRSGKKPPTKRKAESRRNKRKAKRTLLLPYRLHRKKCQTCMDAPKLPVNDRKPTKEEVQKRRCQEGQELFLQVTIN